MRRANTRQLIIDTASRLFYHNGYNLTGINEIIAEAGIAKATLYSHFKSKDDLAVAYLEQRDRNLLIGLEGFLIQKPMGNERLVGIVEFLLSFYEEDEFAGCWCIRTFAEVPAENTLVIDKIRELKGVLMTYIGNQVMINRSDLKSEQQERLTKRIYLLYEAAVSESYMHGAPWPIEESISLLKEILEK